MIHKENTAYLVSAVVCWLLVIYSFLLILNAFLKYVEKWHPARYKLAMVGVFFAWFLAIFLHAYFQYPTLWFENDFISTLSYHSAFAPTISHLFAYAMFLCGLLFLFRNRIPDKVINTDTMPPLYVKMMILILKTISFLLLIYIFEIIKDMVYHSNMNVAVSFIQELRVETFLLLLLELIGAYFYYWFITRVKKFYQDKRNTRTIIYIHLILTAACVCFYAFFGSWLEVVLFLLVSCVILFVDLYETYYPISGFLYSAPISFIFINLIVGLSYHYSTLKMESQYKLRFRSC